MQLRAASLGLVTQPPSQVLQEFPELEQLLEPISRALTDDVMQELNRQVDVEGRDPADVAYEWMISEGFIVEP